MWDTLREILAAVGRLHSLLRPAPTYRVDIGVVAGGAGVAVELVGANDRVIKVKQVHFSKPSAQVTLRMIKLEAASTAGTSTNGTIFPLDRRWPASRAFCRLYTAVPTIGTEVGDVYEGVIGTSDVLWEEFGNITGSSPVVLIGPNDALALRVSAAATIVGYIEFTEE